MSRSRAVRGRWLALTSVLALLAGGRAWAGPVVNGGFESGDFTGWSTIGNASVVDSTFQTGPVEGTYQALVSSANGSVGVSSLETFLNLAPGTLSGLGALQGSAIKQDVTLNGGGFLSFTANFLTSEDPTDPNHNNDFAFATLTPSGSGGSLTQLGDVNTSPLFGSLSPFVFESGFSQVYIPIGASGSYTLGFGVADRGDLAVESGLLVDAVGVSAVPEPSTMVLLAMGAPMVAAYCSRRRGRSAGAAG